VTQPVHEWLIALTEASDNVVSGFNNTVSTAEVMQRQMKFEDFCE
jgi:hypothetical protein